MISFDQGRPLNGCDKKSTRSSSIRIIGVLLAFSTLLQLRFLHNIHRKDFKSSTNLIPSTPKYSHVPENYAENLHFLIQVIKKKDCGGCDVLLELYHTLLAQNFSANISFSLSDVPSGRFVVVVYPEVSYLTWKYGDIHVRWVLAPLGVNSPKNIASKWNLDDLVFTYGSSFVEDVSVKNMLQVVNTPAEGDETDISDELFYSKNRSGIAWMMRKGPKFHANIVPIHNRSGFISTQVDGKLSVSGLRKFEFFVSYDPYSYWSWFAAMMGTVSIVYPLANVSKDEWAFGTFLGGFMQDRKIKEIPGIAYGWEDHEIDFARRTMHKLRPLLVKFRAWGAEVTVKRFTRDCYRYSQGEREYFESAKLIRDIYQETA
jgi:hypothetical protein